MTANIKYGALLKEQRPIQRNNQKQLFPSLICSNHFFGPGAKQSDETRGRGGCREEEVAKPVQQPRRKIRYAPL